MPLVAHALDAHRPAHRLRQQGRVDPGVAGVVAPVGAGARDPDPVHLVLRQPERAGDPIAREMRLLRAGPQGRPVLPRVDDGAGRAHAGMRLERPLVFGLDDASGTGKDRVDFTFRDRRFALDDGRLTDVLIECGIFGKGWCCLGPGDLEPLGRLHRVPFALGDDAEEALVAHDPNAGDVVHRALVDRDRHRTGDRRADHAAVQHPRHLDVGHVVEGAKDLGRDVETRRRGADDLVGAGRLGLGLPFGDKVVAELAVPLHRQVEIAVADQLAIAEFARRIARHGDDAVDDFEPIGRHAEPRRGQLEEHAARLGRGIAQGDAALLHPGAAARTTLVDGPLGVAHHDADPRQRHVELLGDDLGDRDIDPLAHVHLAEIGDDSAVGLDRQPAVELVGGKRRLDRAAGFSRGEPAG